MGILGIALAIIGFVFFIWLISEHSDIFVAIVLVLLVCVGLFAGSSALADYFPPWHYALTIASLVSLIVFWLAVVVNRECVRETKVPFFAILIVAILLLPIPILGFVNIKWHSLVIGSVPFWSVLGIIGVKSIQDKSRQPAQRAAAFTQRGEPISKFGCPFYKNASCGIGDGGFSCSLPSGVPYTECYPYKVEVASKKKCPKCGYEWESTGAGLDILGIGGRTSVIGPDPSKCPRCGLTI